MPTRKWVTLYLAAMYERRRSMIQERLVAARTEISDRLAKLDGATDSSEERLAIDDALNALNAVEYSIMCPTHR